MNLNKILITGLLSSAVLLVSIMLTINLGAAHEIPDSEQDSITKLMLPLTQETVDEGSDMITQAVFPEAELETEQGVINVTVSLDKSADLPDRIPDLTGVLLEQSGGSFWVDSYSSRMVDGKPNCQSFTGGKGTEITFNESTRFIEDATDFNQAKPLSSSTDLIIQQNLLSIQQPDALPNCASMLIWGNWQGDQLTADVILFHDEFH